MALIDLGLLHDETEYVDTTGGITGADLIGLDALSSPTTVFYGNGTADLTTGIGAGALSNTNMVATGGADVTVSAGLLNVNVLTSQNYYIDGDSSITLVGPTANLLGLSALLNATTIRFSGSGDGTFTYEPSTLGVLSYVTFTVEEMGPGDRIVIPIAGNGVSGSNTLREVGYNNGYLELRNGSNLPVLSEQINIRIAMTQAEYNVYAANKAAYLLGATDTFIFPGNDDGEPPYVVPCFTAGTVIETASGLQAIETLKVGDLVMTADHGLKPVRWIGSVKIDQATLDANPHMIPVRISAGALGHNLPVMDLTVSPQHRVLVASKVAERMLGSTEVLVAAKQLLVVDGVDVVETAGGIEYFHFLLDQHEVVFSNGAQTESLYTGPMAMLAVGRAARDEILALFPEIADLDYLAPAARPLASGRQARKLAMRHVDNKKPLIQ